MFAAGWTWYIKLHCPATNWLGLIEHSGRSELWIDVEVSSRLIESMEDTVLLRVLIYR